VESPVVVEGEQARAEVVEDRAVAEPVGVVEVVAEAPLVAVEVQ